jgi:hypothetical protein
MKKNLGISIALCLAIISCKKEASSVQNSESKTDSLNVAEKMVIDSVKVNDTLEVGKNVTGIFSSKVLVFPNLKNKTLLDSIYSPEKISLLDYSKKNLSDYLSEEQKKFFEEQKKVANEYPIEFVQNWEENSDMNLLSNENDFMTLIYTGNGFSGGAHGYYFEKYKVFDLKNNKTLQLGDIISNQNSKIWNRILMDKFLKNDLDKGQSEMLLVKEIPLNNNFYFDKEYLYFLYNQYEITAYAAGTVLIKVPFSAIKPYVQSEFKKRLGL